MGFYESALALFVIPVFVIILALLANGTGRRQLNKLLLTVIGIEIKVGGYHFKLINMLTLTNLFYVCACLAKISRLNVLHANESENHHHSEGDLDPFHRGNYMKEIYVTYRAMLMNVSSIVLTLCLTIATEQYEVYKPISDQAKRLSAK